MDQIKRLLEGEKLHPVRFGRGATEREVQGAEAALGVTFPTSYRTFLKRLGWIESPCISVFGLGSDIDSAYEVISVTHCERHEAGVPLPANLLPIVNDGSGNLYCLDVSQMQGSECPVVFWDHEAPEGAEQVPARVGADFYSWLLHEITELSS